MNQRRGQSSMALRSNYRLFLEQVQQGLIDLDEAADALEAQAKEIEKLRTALELVMRHVALALPKDVCAIANEALKGLA